MSPTASPSLSPSSNPSVSPTSNPTDPPSDMPSMTPSESIMPSTEPSEHPSQFTLPARYVKLSLSGADKIINIHEVQVFDSSGTNLAVAGIASQSSTFVNSEGFSFYASNANNNNTASVLAHTQSSQDPWWKVDLLGMHQIKSIIIWNRRDSYSYRLSYATVALLDENDNILSEVVSVGDTTGVASIELNAETFTVSTASPSLSPTFVSAKL